MRELLKAVPVFIFAALFVYKIIKTQSIKGFLNIGKLERLGLLEVLDYIVMSILAFTSLRYSFNSHFEGLLIEWLQIIGSLVILYRFFYMGISRMLFKNQAIIKDLRIKSFFK